MIIRQALPKDVPVITHIYNHYITHSTVVWAKATVTSLNRQNWLDELKRRGYPVFVAISDGIVVGYSDLAMWMDYPCYRYTAEDSVYVHPHVQRRGIGTALLKALIDNAAHHNIHQIVAGIDSQNTPSIYLHKNCGFKRCGYLPQIGQKFGHWLDLVYMCHRL